MIDHAIAQSELLAMWERGEGQRPSRRALALLAGASPGTEEAAAAALPIGVRDASLLALREALFGSAFRGVTTCPSCGEEIELTFDAAEVRKPDGESAPHDALECLHEGVRIEFRLPTTADLAAIESVRDLRLARDELFARCIVRATREGGAIESRDMPAGAIDAVAARMAALDPQADVQVGATCPACAHTWLEPFDIVAFLWSEVAVTARRLLAEIHALALAYGWSESDILRLSPARRQAYLEMVR